MLITKYVLGTELLPTITKGLTIATVLTQRFTEWIGKNQDTLRKWWGWIKTLGTAFLTWKAIGLASIVMLKSFTIATTAAKMATILFTGGFKALSVAMRLNPFGFIITAIQLLAAGFVIAYDKIDGFRGAISAIGGVFTAVGEAIVATFLNPLKSAVEAWQHFKNFEFGKAALSAGKGILQFQYMMPRLIANSHSIARERWDKDYEKGVNSNFKISDWIVDIAGNLLGMPKIGAAADSLNSTTGSSDFSTDGNQDISSGLDSISSGGRSVKNVTVNIENLWKGDIKVDSRHTRMELRELERTIKEVLLRAIGGAEQAMG